MKNIVKNKKTIVLFLITFLLLNMLFLSFVTAFVTAFVSAESGIIFDETNVLDDLQSSENFNIVDYPFDSLGVAKHPSIINFVEYCYSFNKNKQDNYGLYLYFYNPQKLEILPTSKSNKVEIAVKYDKGGNAIDYEKFNLKFCSMSDGDYANLFYKFKIVDKKSADGKTILERVNSNERHYDISGVELISKGSNNALDYSVGGSYVFSGYSAGYGADYGAASTLASSVKDLETVQLDVKHTFYRTKSSSKGAGYQNQLDTAYFAVPKRLFETFGFLQRIKADWYEYKTKDIVVTSNQAFYNAALPFIGVPIGSSYNKDLGISLGQDARSVESLNAALWGYNLSERYICSTVADPLYYSFFTNGDIKDFDPYAEITSTGGVASSVLYDYIKRYDKSFANGRLPIKNNEISADLFASDIDDYRKVNNANGKIQQGYSFYDFDASVDLQKLSSWKDTDPSFWDNWMTYGFWDTAIGNIPEEQGKTVAPIYQVKESDLSGTNAEVSERLLVNANDVSAMREFYNDAVTVDGLDKNDEEKVVILFRFATSDYYSAPVDIIKLPNTIGFESRTKGQAYRAWESVFFDFDIIQLSFQKDGVYKVIPAVSNPIDIVNGITPPVNMPSSVSWKTILMILAIVILIIVFFPVLLMLLKFVFLLISLPFRLIGKIVKICKNNKNSNSTK